VDLVLVVVAVAAINSLFSLASYRRRRMRFFAGLLILFSLQWSVFADSSLNVTTHYYSLEPGLTITKPIIAFENDLSLQTTLNARITVDRVETNYDDVDAVSGASQFTGELDSSVDTRQEYVVSASHIVGNWTFSGGYLRSIEKDYKSHSPSVSFSRDFNRRNTTLSAGYAHNFDTVEGRYMSEAESKNVDNFSLALTQVLTPRSLMQVGYTLQANDGFLSTGNRQIKLENDLLFDEFLPSTRTRHAVALRYAHWLPTKTALHAGYRYYQDDWQLTSNTLELKAYQNISKRLQLRAELRFYDQSAVEFMKTSYTGNENYLTSASSLKAFSSKLYGLKLNYSPRNLGNSQFQLKYERYSQSTGLEGDIFMFAGEFVF